MRFSGISSVEQTKQKVRRIQVCPKEKQIKEKKTSDYNCRALFTISAIAAKLLKSQVFIFFFTKSFVILKISGILFSNEYKRQIYISQVPTTSRF